MTVKTKADRARTFLRDSENGLTANEIAERTGFDLSYTRVMLNQMPDAYIASWTRTEAGAGFRAVWKVAHVPSDAPRPKSVPRPRKEYDAQYREKRRKEKAEAKPEQPTGPKTVWAKVPTWDEYHGLRG